MALDHEVRSPRLKEVVHPAGGVWMHHVTVGDVGDLDEELGALLLDAARRAG